MIKSRKVLMVLSLFILLVVGLTGCGTNRAKKIGLSRQNSPTNDELLMLDTKEDVELIMDIIKSAKKDKDLPIRKEVFYYITIYYHNNKEDRFTLAKDPDRDLFFIYKDFIKGRVYTITEEQFETLGEIYNR